MLIVDEHEVRAAHFVRRWCLSGAQVGPERDDVWFDTATGLPIENSRTIEVKVHTPFGDSTYTESSRFTLRSLTPER